MPDACPDNAAPPPRAVRKLASQKLAVLIDDDNLSIGAEKIAGCRVDYARLMDAINHREIIRAILYRPAKAMAERPFPLKLQHFLERRLGIEVKTPPKNVDCWLTVDAIALADKVDVVVLVAGDVDYEPLVHYLKAHGCKVEIWSWLGRTSQRLREAADSFSPLTTEMLYLPPTAETT